MAIEPRTFRSPGVHGRRAARAHERALQRRPESIDVREIRDRMGMSQIHFSVVFGIPVATLRHWADAVKPVTERMPPADLPDEA
jgi:DNA-binding transcriptional regulator YiaG